jgi:hypothetical protein
MRRISEYFCPGLSACPQLALVHCLAFKSRLAPQGKTMAQGFLAHNPPGHIILRKK